ncbi:MAG: tRNA threonylcarbamoyladenosine dehydratase [Cellulosilyticum sp.]|nr:tRNA threonylcarbamoyladenosine dehydratase [Cellulosilyticum sp.]
MSEQFIRTELVFGSEAIEKLQRSYVAVFGVGGVGGFVVEALARSGVGKFDLIDNDTVCLSNINRQIIATHSTVDRYKVDVMKERILDINPNAEVNIYKCFYLPETAGEFDFTKYDYIVDAIDTITAKIDIIVRAQEAGVPIMSSMGAGNKIDPTKFVVTDIYKTSVCPLAKVMRKELKARGVKKLKVVYSTEVARKPIELGKSEVRTQVDEEHVMPKKRQTPGSTAFVPSVAGLIIAGEVIKDITGVR